MVKLTFLVISILISGVAFVALKMRNSRNRASGKKFIKSLQSGNTDMEWVYGELIWTAGKRRTQEVDIDAIVQLEKIETLFGQDGFYKLEHVHVTPKHEVLISAMGEHQRFTGGKGDEATYQTEVNFHLFLLRHNSESDHFEVKSEICLSNEEKQIKLGFAEALFQQLAHKKLEV